MCGNAITRSRTKPYLRLGNANRSTANSLTLRKRIDESQDRDVLLDLRIGPSDYTSRRLVGFPLRRVDSKTLPGQLLVRYPQALLRPLGRFAHF